MVVALLIGADVAIRRAVELQLEHRLRDEVAEAQGVPPQRTRVHVKSFPFLARLAASGEVATLEASVADVEVAGFRFASVAVDLHDVRLDRNDLVSHRRVTITSIGSGQATADITQAAVREALGGAPLVLGDGTIGVTVAGRTVSVSARVTDGVLQLTAAGVRLPAITLPELPLIPCLTQAVARPGVLHLSCAVDQVPAELLQRLPS